jgi:hypothetical protein
MTGGATELIRSLRAVRVSPASLPLLICEVVVKCGVRFVSNEHQRQVVSAETPLLGG